MNRKSIPLLRSALTGLALMLLAAPLALAAYWTVPVNYYQLERIRYPLAIGETAVTKLPNLGVAQKNVGTAEIRSGRLAGKLDPERGLSGVFNTTQAPQLVYPYPEGLSEKGEASLSLWIKLDIDGNGDRVIAARGDVSAGFTLHTLGRKLVFVYWDGTGKAAVKSKRELQTGEWYNVIVTQSSSRAPQGPYTAIYVNGVLEAAGGSDIRSGGLLAGTGQGPGTIGSASTSGYLYTSHSGFSDYRRNGSDASPIDGVQSFANALLSDFRLFYGEDTASAKAATLVCSDKTSDGDVRAANTQMLVGSRCVITSDISSISQNRVEQASYLARLPFQREPSDHNFIGLSSLGNAQVNCTTCKLPDFVEDNLQLRHSVARFTGSEIVEYIPSLPTPLLMGDWKAPYSVSMWVKSAPGGDPQRAQTLYQVGNEGTLRQSEGFHIYLHDGDIFAGVWSGQCGEGVWARGRGPSAGVWQHIAVSFDAPQNQAAPGAPNGLQVFLNGELVGSADTRAILAPKPHTTAIGQTGPAGGCGDAHPVPFYAQGFRGEMSEIKVLRGPITAPQARQFASRFPNAYTPDIDVVEYPQRRAEPDSEIPQIKRMTYFNSVPTEENGFWAADKVNPSVNLEWVIDWREAIPRWTGFTEKQIADKDCEYMLGGFFWYKADVPPEETSSVLLCFSPWKISESLPPFSIGLYYPEYQETLYLTVVDRMLTPDDLEQLAHYGDEDYPAPDLFSKINLNVGAYNMILQLSSGRFDLNKQWPAPNFVSPIYQGAPSLLKQTFAFDANPPPHGQVTFVWPWAAVYLLDPAYVDQQQLLDDFDMQLSKDR